MGAGWSPLRARSLDQPRNTRGSAIRNVLDAVRIAAEAHGELRRTCGGVRHGFVHPLQPDFGNLVHALGLGGQGVPRMTHRRVQPAQTERGNLIQALGLTGQNIGGHLHPVALGLDCAVRGLGFLLQTREQLEHRNALALLPCKHELRTRGCRLPGIFDFLGLAVELDCGGLRRTRGATREHCRNWATCESQQVSSGGLQFAAGVFNDGFELCGAPGQDFGGAQSRFVEPRGQLFDPVAFGAKALRDVIGSHAGPRAGIFQLGDAFFERGLERAKPAQRAIEPRGERIEFAPHGTAQTLRVLHGAFIGRRQAAGNQCELARCIGQRKRAGKRKGGCDKEQWRKEDHHRGESNDLRVEARKALRGDIAPEIGAGSSGPERAHDRSEDENAKSGPWGLKNLRAAAFTGLLDLKHLALSGDVLFRRGLLTVPSDLGS